MGVLEETNKNMKKISKPSSTNNSNGENKQGSLEEENSNNGNLPKSTNTPKRINETKTIPEITNIQVGSLIGEGKGNVSIWLDRSNRIYYFREPLVAILYLSPLIYHYRQFWEGIQRDVGRYCGCIETIERSQRNGRILTRGQHVVVSE